MEALSQSDKTCRIILRRRSANTTVIPYCPRPHVALFHGTLVCAVHKARLEYEEKKQAQKKKNTVSRRMKTLVHIPPVAERDMLLAHLLGTHDIAHQIRILEKIRDTDILHDIALIPDEREPSIRIKRPRGRPKRQIYD